MLHSSRIVTTMTTGRSSGSFSFFSSSEIAVPPGRGITTTDGMAVELSDERIRIEIYYDGVLRASLKNLWKTKRFLNSYVNNLLGYIDDADLQKDLERYAKDEQPCDAQSVRQAWKYLETVIEEHLDPEDIADLLSVSLDDVLKAEEDGERSHGD